MAKDVRRWHGTDCVQPDVCVGNDLVPFCQACGISAFAVLQTLTTGESSSVPQVPADEAPGQHNLFWPPSVPYTDIEVHGTTDEKEQFPEKTRGPEESDKGKTMGGLGDSVYTKSLSSRQIRLIVLAASPRGQKNFLIHFSLEIHDDLRCPEYDAVSYTWGGEENDYTR
ncbi:heterokaryon incompatibility protein het-6-like protein [Colletotrichum plurivorum]|uniref:Heterokaryon incompatibility protein het-6-like protein n=1 Tax=Colletotrichum plurivorum TaxID=2175906 RepID=A0A8H6MPG3_9PEZI|nr:heterokaryon incompatibility protein het-6-like protein [Colletotrichum plurivorum]